MFDCEAYLNSLDMFGIRLGLAATEELMALAGHPEKGLRFIHLAGTNGKGSTGAMLERCFRKAGLKTGFYTSPHLIDVRERFRINGKAVSVEEFNCAGEFLKERAGEGKFSYFEFATVLAMVIFARNQVDAVIWETGMGGRLDATNVVMPEACVITNIALDHQGHLGDTTAAIAGEKAGIIKRGVPLFHGVLPDDAARVICQRAKELDAPVFPPREAVPDVDDFTGKCQNFVYDGRRISLSLPGRMQRENFRIVYEVLSCFAPRWHFDVGTVLTALSEVSWPGRFQHVDGLIIDGGHNPDGVRALTEAVKERYPYEKFLVVYAAFGDKAAPRCLPYLDTIAERYIFTTPGAGGRAAFAPEELTGMTGKPAAAITEPAVAIRQALAECGDLRIIVSGSLYLAGVALEIVLPPESVLDL
ncbi:MAG: bifunctional folylpolyglutamate synthase/dihydrofolate synthase [Lentisphaerae bacterium]|nr:bifunctional folylpolyglutamate synthase/dihydrofolate synthase [Lentisphaerota bacterium]